MRVFVLFCAFLFSGVCGAAAEMQFLTLLSQPVGSFSAVDVVDPGETTEIYHLNFCNNENLSGGSIFVKGVIKASQLYVLDGKVISKGGAGNNGTYYPLKLVNVISMLGVGSDLDEFVGGSLTATSSNPRFLFLTLGDGNATLRVTSNPIIVTSEANFMKLNVSNTAKFSSAASTKAMRLGWSKIYDPSDTKYPDAYVLTNHSGVFISDMVK